MFINSSPEGTGEKRKLIPPEINISVHLNEENIRKPSSRHGQLSALPQQKKKTAIKWEGLPLKCSIDAICFIHMCLRTQDWRKLCGHSSFHPDTVRCNLYHLTSLNDLMNPFMLHVVPSSLYWLWDGLLVIGQVIRPQK